MSRIDAHSGAVANEYYALQNPADNAILVQDLVLEVLTGTVPWRDVTAATVSDLK